MNRSLTLLPRLGLYLNLSRPRDILKLNEGTVSLCRHKLPDICLEYAQVLNHLGLLCRSKLRAAKNHIYEHLGDLCHRLSHLTQVQLLLSQPLILHQGNIPCVKHLLELRPDHNSSLLRSMGTNH